MTRSSRQSPKNATATDRVLSGMERANREKRSMSEPRRYVVTIRGGVPDELGQVVSKFHAVAVAVVRAKGSA